MTFQQTTLSAAQYCDWETEVRYPVNEEATLKPIKGERLPIRICEVARHAMRVELSSNLVAGSSVCVRLAGLVALAHVRQSERVGGKFSAELRVSVMIPVYGESKLPEGFCPSTPDFPSFGKGERQNDYKFALFPLTC